MKTELIHVFVLFVITPILEEEKKQGPTRHSGYRKVPSKPSSARSRLAILEQLQYKSYVVLGAALEATSVLSNPISGARRTLVCNCRCSYVATTAKIWLQEPKRGHNSQHVAAGAMKWLQEPRLGYREF